MDRRLYRKKIDKILWIPFYAFLIGIVAVFFLVRITGYAECEGVIEPENYLPVVSQYTGRIEATEVEEGGDVEASQVMFRFDSEDLDYRERTLSAQLKNLTKSISLMESRLLLMGQKSSIVEEEYLHLIGLYRKLYRDGGTERKRYEDKVYEYNRYKAEYNLERNSLLLEKSGLEKIELTTRIELEELIKRKDKLEIKSPCRGKIVSTQTIYRRKESLDYFSPEAKEDSFVEEGALLGYVIQGSSVVGKVRIPEEKRDKIAVGQEVKITVATHRGTKFLLITGRLEEISLTAQDGKFLGTISIENEKKGIDGMDILGTTITAKIKLKRESLFRQLFGF